MDYRFDWVGEDDVVPDLGGSDVVGGADVVAEAEAETHLRPTIRHKK